jgi:SPP1 family predicted phage head-tail adaptor
MGKVTKLEAGRLRHRVTIQERIQVQDAHGDIVPLWRDWATNVPAEIVPVSAREFVAGQGIQAQVTTKIRIRWRRGLEPTMRILHLIDSGSPQVYDYYNIAGILADPDSGHVYVWLPCSKGLNLG